MDVLVLERTRSGLPVLWERGGGWSNTGSAVIVAGPAGEKKRPVYIRRRGHLAGGERALFVVRPGDHVTKASHHRFDFQVRVYRIVQIEDGEQPKAYAEEVASWDMGEWVPPLPTHLEAAVEAARKKATCYHCRGVHHAAE